MGQRGHRENRSEHFGLCLVTLDSLVAELVKTRPNEVLVKEWMTQVGLVYSRDPEERLSIVLQALYGPRKRRARRADETSV